MAALAGVLLGLAQQLNYQLGFNILLLICVMAALQAQGTPFDLMLFPGQRHGITTEPRQLQLWRTYLQFFARELDGAEPPNATP